PPREPRAARAVQRSADGFHRKTGAEIMNNKVALVTGAGTGIGKAAALALLKDGYRVALVGRRRELLDKAAADSGAAERALVLASDITRPEVVKEIFGKVMAKWGRLDVLFNNAGMGAPAVPMEDLPLETWKAVVDINLNAMFFCCQEAIRIMKAQNPKGGRIINNGSISAHAPRPMSAPRCCTWPTCRSSPTCSS